METIADQRRSLAVSLEGNRPLRPEKVVVEAEPAFSAGGAGRFCGARYDHRSGALDTERLIAREVRDDERSRVALTPGLLDLVRLLYGSENAHGGAPSGPGDRAPSVRKGPNGASSARTPPRRCGSEHGSLLHARDVATNVQPKVTATPCPVLWNLLASEGGVDSCSFGSDDVVGCDAVTRSV